VILAPITGGILSLMTGSLVLPLVALAMNVLTVAVGAGLLVLIFQEGHASSLLGFSPIGGLEESNLVLLFVVAFALSTDYGGRLGERTWWAPRRLRRLHARVGLREGRSLGGLPA
jgi:uncharacterized membrane protein YdfJ with MMPL/SSD domain